MQQVILTLVFLFSSILISKAQESKSKQFGTVEVSVVNALNDEGTIQFALFNKENFRMQPLFAKSSIIKNGVSSVLFENIPLGEYAIISFHDENGNNKMDFELNGMPKESYGTSNNTFNVGPPQFENAKFIVSEEALSLEIKF